MSNRSIPVADVSLVDSPEWAKDLIIYEVATKGFTSPRGPETGTFDSLKEKISYLADLGTTAIWLTGHSLSDFSHFFNIWSQYACINPGQLDPSLGDEKSFRDMINEAHRYGIRVILDIISHGVIKESPLVHEHPQWFIDGSWNMTDYDWFGGHKDFESWWIETITRYVIDFGIDGFRVDVVLYRPDVWARIRQRCAELRHPIIILTEDGPGFRGVTDSIQHCERLSRPAYGLDLSHSALNDVAGFIDDVLTSKTKYYEVKIETMSGEILYGTTEKTVQFSVINEGCREYWESFEEGGYVRTAQSLYIVGQALRKMPIKNVTVFDKSGFAWFWKHENDFNFFQDNWIDVSWRPNGLLLRFSVRMPKDQWVLTQLSCHDNGTVGFDRTRNPYVAQGSRFVFGYALLLSPPIPLFMAGEEWDADFVPLPRLSPYLFGGQDPGQGTWLYGSWIQWEQLTQERHASMLVDVKRLISIRKRERDLIGIARVGHKPPNIVPIDLQASCTLPRPYLYYSDACLLVVAGNPLLKDVAVQLNLPYDQLPAEIADKLEDFIVEDLWGSLSPKHYTKKTFQKTVWTMPADKRPSGGLLILKIRPLK
jgi:hypothetical protein